MPSLTTHSMFSAIGLVNNALYVIILTLAMDLAPPNTPQSLILLLNILPGLVLKSSAPFLIHNRVAHDKRVVVLIFVNGLAMWLIAFGFVYSGIFLASLMSGLGELTFLQIASSFGSTGINGWSLGTGLAGIFGSLFVLLLTSIFKVSVKNCLLGSSLIPLGFGLYWMLPDSYLKVSSSEDGVELEEQQEDLRKIDKKLLLKNLLYPFMLPLMVVYFAEYLINQGITPVLLFPFKETSLLFHKFRDEYVLYGTMYQLGVLISRSSGRYIRIKHVWLLSLLQIVNLVLFLLEALYFPSESIFVIAIFSFYEGLLGGSSYVNVFLNVNDLYKENIALKEFSIGVVTMSDSFGILLAAVIGLVLEPKLCQYQVHHGRNYCRS